MYRHGVDTAAALRCAGELGHLPSQDNDMIQSMAFFVVGAIQRIGEPNSKRRSSKSRTTLLLDMLRRSGYNL